jgi:RNA polymerase sigma-70 factor (ECF subfamily)
LEGGLEFLSPNLRAAVVLRDIQGLSTEESAEALDISIASLKSRLHRARILLRKPWNRIRRYRCCPIRRPWPILSKTP